MYIHANASTSSGSSGIPTHHTAELKFVLFWTTLAFEMVHVYANANDHNNAIIAHVMIMFFFI